MARSFSYNCLDDSAITNSTLPAGRQALYLLPLQMEGEAKGMSLPKWLFIKILSNLFYCYSVQFIFNLDRYYSNSCVG